VFSEEGIQRRNRKEEEEAFGKDTANSRWHALFHPGVPQAQHSLSRLAKSCQTMTRDVSNNDSRCVCCVLWCCTLFSVYCVWHGGCAGTGVAPGSLLHLFALSRQPCPLGHKGVTASLSLPLLSLPSPPLPPPPLLPPLPPLPPLPQIQDPKPQIPNPKPGELRRLSKDISRAQEGSRRRRSPRCDPG
jgi:hypothetical protein